MFSRPVTDFPLTIKITWFIQGKSAPNKRNDKKCGMNRIGAVCCALLVSVPALSFALREFSLRLVLLRTMISIGGIGLVVVSSYRWWAV
jgi:hypothetical protein